MINSVFLSKRKGVRLAAAGLLLLVSVGLLFAQFTNFSRTPSYSTSQDRDSATEVSVATEYNIRSGKWKQVIQLGEIGERLLSVTGNGKGQLILSFDKVAAFVVGSDKVVIETTWAVDGDYVTFIMESGTPGSSFQRVMMLSLEKITRFRITDFQSDSMTMERVKDGEVFQWIHIGDQDSVTDDSSLK